MAAKAKKTAEAPVWLKVVAGLVAVAVLAGFSYSNIHPTFVRYWYSGDQSAIGPLMAQSGFTLMLGMVPFVPAWRGTGLCWVLTVGFALGSGLFVVKGAAHWHDGEKTAAHHRETLANELNQKQQARTALPVFTPTSAGSVAIARDNATKAAADKTKAEADKAKADDAKAKADAAVADCASKRWCDGMLALKRAAKSADNEVVRLQTEVVQKSAAAQAASETLQRLSGWQGLTDKAAALDGRIDELQQQLASEKIIADTSGPEWLETVEAVLQAILIEGGNRFGPEGAYGFILFVFGYAALSSSPVSASAEEVKPKRFASETANTPAAVPAGPLEKVAALIDERFEFRPGARLFVSSTLKPFVLKETGCELNGNELKLVKKLMEARGWKHESPKGGRSYYQDVGIKVPPLSHRAKGPHLAVDNTLASVG